MISLKEAWKKIGYDCHIHLREHVDPPLCAGPHQLAPMLEMANARGLIPCIREHALLPKALCIGPNLDYLYGLRYDEVDSFFEMFKKAKLAVGLELDYVIGFQPEICQIVEYLKSKASEHEVQFSSLAGSVHILPGKLQDIEWDKTGIDVVLWELTEDIFHEYVKQRGAKRILDDYFDGLEKIIQMGIFDVISHLDLIRKLDRRSSSNPSPTFGHLEDYYLSRCRRIVELAFQNKLIIEINTSGINRNWGQPYIQQSILNYCGELGVGIQVGSDAHKPTDIGQYFDVAYEMLMQAGIQNIVIFENRKPVKKSIL